VAEEVPSTVASSNRKGFSPTAIIAGLTKVLKEQQEQIAALQEGIALRKEKPD
jgi:hypothetical protein